MAASAAFGTFLGVTGGGRHMTRVGRAGPGYALNGPADPCVAHSA
jgi:hypothetical protein